VSRATRSLSRGICVLAIAAGMAAACGLDEGRDQQAIDSSKAVLDMITVTGDAEVIATESDTLKHPGFRGSSRMSGV
jgi:hypothetical protein